MAVQEEPNPDPAEVVVPYSPGPRELCTPPLFWFLHRQIEIYNFFFFGVRLATTIDENRVTAAKALAESGSDADRERLKKVMRQKDYTFTELTKFARLQSENMCIRSVDNFISYLSEAIQMVLTKRPEMLRSGETVRLDEILQFTTYSDMVTFLIDKRVTRLAFGGVNGLEQFLTEKTGFTLSATDEERSLLTVAVELRNIYTHTRGLVSEVTMKRLQSLEHGFDFRKGKRYDAGFEELVTLTNNLVAIARRLDGGLAQKFAIRRKRFSTLRKAMG